MWKGVKILGWFVLTASLLFSYTEECGLTGYSGLHMTCRWLALPTSAPPFPHMFLAQMELVIPRNYKQNIQQMYMRDLLLVWSLGLAEGRHSCGLANISKTSLYTKCIIVFFIGSYYCYSGLVAEVVVTNCSGYQLASNIRKHFLQSLFFRHSFVVRPVPVGSVLKVWFGFPQTYTVYSGISPRGNI